MMFMRNSKWRFSIISLCFCLLIVAGCSSTNTDHDQTPVSIAFNPLTSDDLVLEGLDDDHIDEIVIEYETEEGTFFIFSKPEQSQSHQYYAGFNNGSAMVEFWEMGYALDHLHIESVQVFGQSLIKMIGICGAACPINLYVYADERQPQLLLASQWHTHEVDLDQDGNNEIIKSIGTQPDSKIVIYENGQLLESDSLSETIHGVTSIFYSLEKEAFWASDVNQEERYYVYDDKALVPLK